MTLIRINANGDVDTVNIRNDDTTSSLQNMYAAIGNGCTTVETVSVVCFPFPVVAILDENGLAHGAEHNMLASVIAGTRIAGNVLISAVGMVDDDIDFIGLTEKQTEEMMDTFREFGKNML